MLQGPILLVILIASFLFIILLTTKFKFHPFYVLLLAAFGTGIAAGMPALDVIKNIVDGFGKIMGSIGIIIICGTTIGVLLERSGAALSMASFFLKLVGKKRIPLSTSIFGYTVSIPIFCDSGFVLLSPLNKALAEASKMSMAVMAVVLSSALYATHCLVPPHPGPTAAVASVSEFIDTSLKANLMGRVVILGLICAIPGVIVGYLWATRFAKRYFIEAKPEISYEILMAKYKKLPNVFLSFVPILLPVFLIGLGSFSLLPQGLSFVGTPTAALMIGVFAALLLVPKWNAEVFNNWLDDGVKAAGVILAITAAGGSFGTILRATHIGDYLSQTLSSWNLGLLLPFLMTAAIKTAQGSSTVSIITTAPLVASMLPSMRLDTGWGPTFVLLAMGAGSIMVSHANDSYFWVVTKFSDLDVSTAYKVFTSATFLIGMVTMGFIYLLYLIFL
jgi:GntP family gluconate:H+ symporter